MTRIFVVHFAVKVVLTLLDSKDIYLDFLFLMGVKHLRRPTMTPTDDTTYNALKEFEGYIADLQADFPGLAIQEIFPTVCYDCGNFTGEVSLLLNQGPSRELNDALWNMTTNGKHRIPYEYKGDMR